MYLVLGGQPSAAFQYIGKRPVALAFPLPTSYSAYRNSPWENQLPVAAAGWDYAIRRIETDLVPKPEPFHSKLFPRWKSVDSRAVRAIDTAVTHFAAVKLATEAALRRCVAATNKHEEAIQTTEAEELFEKLVAIAARNKLPRARAEAVVEANRDW